MLVFIKSSLTWYSIVDLENGFAHLPESLENQDAYTQMQSILVASKQQLAEENLGCLSELPMADAWMEEIIELFAELPMAS